VVIVLKDQQGLVGSNTIEHRALKSLTDRSIQKDSVKNYLRSFRPPSILPERILESHAENDMSIADDKQELDRYSLPPKKTRRTNLISGALPQRKTGNIVSTVIIQQTLVCPTGECLMKESLLQCACSGQF